MVISSPSFPNFKSWLVQKQTAIGKDFSNPLIADSLLKTIRDFFKETAKLFSKGTGSSNF
jgi:hypothetical protein